ncbi:MAG: molybdopterin-synthase adenylyltransferase MoeB [Rhodobacteraceae bacterium]|nr:molybdopterin-synthase adenylyltransferase MoeB [Paracoccaceae bacterium]
MALFLALAILVWLIGWRRGTPRQARLMQIALLYLVFAAAAVLMPETGPLRRVLGGSAGEWLSVGGLVALGAAYVAGLGWLRGRVRPENRAHPAAPAAPAAPSDRLGEAEVERYARHIVMHEIGGPGQRKLKAARVLVIGAGGLGSPVLQYLAAAGFGTIGVIDDDTVSVDNLQRQVIHSEATVGMPKVFSASQAMAGINPHVLVRPYRRRFEPGAAAELLSEYDLVLDGSDNFDTRYLANRACAAAGLPLVAGAITQWEGQITVYDPARGGPCLECVFPERPAAGLVPTCAEAGVAAPLPGVVGSIMALEALKIVTGAGAPLRGAMLIVDGLYGETRRITLARRDDCPVCGTCRDAYMPGRTEETS